MTDANHLPEPGKITPGNVPPSDLDAEGQILSWVMLQPGDIDRCISEELQPQHFYADANRRVYESILRIHEVGQEPDVVEVAGDLRSLGRLDQIGGTPYLAQLTDLIPIEPRAGILEQRCQAVIAHWKARQTISIAQVTVARLYHPQGIPSQTIIEELETDVWQVAQQHRSGGYESAGPLAHAALSVLAEALRDGKTILGVTTGFVDLDKKTTGYHAGQLTIVAARPGVGKTAWICSSILLLTAPPRDPDELPDAVYLHSCEMPKDEIALRLVCSLARVEFQRLKLNQISREDWVKLFEAAADLSRRAIFIDDKSAVTVAEFRSNIRKIKRAIEIGLIRAKALVLSATDYLQLMQGEKSQGREREISSITQGLKNTAKSEGVPVVALAQLNRAVEIRSKDAKQKRPQLSDLRESGAIEQDADNIYFLYREKYYDKEANDEAEVIIAKQRSGPTCTVLLAFDGPTTTFRALAKGYEEFSDFGDPAGGSDLPADDAWYNR